MTDKFFTATAKKKIIIFLTIQIKNENEN